uniref:Peroxisomal ATPase PEX1 n=1 Tax=Trypanosoma congolense (strain IL3000) TaxID=1068625 RepID=F9WHE4_TRYCI|nr:unnamed protein product [Trypanosoma congolense IL3000]
MRVNSFEVSVDPSRTDAFVLASKQFITENLSPYYGRQAPPVVPLRLSDGHRVTYVGCLTHYPHDRGPFKLIISVTIARSLGIADGATMSCTPVFNFTRASSVLVRPSTVDDSEVVEQNALRIEAQLLRQVQVVFPAMTLEVAVFDGVSAKVMVERIQDPMGNEVTSGCAVMSDGTEFVVATRTRHVTQVGSPKWSVLRCKAWGSGVSPVVASNAEIALHVNPTTAVQYQWTDGLVVGFWDLAKASQLVESKEITPSFLRANALRGPVRFTASIPEGICVCPVLRQASNVVVFPNPEETIPDAADKNHASASIFPFSTCVTYDDVVAVHRGAPEELRRHLMCWFETAEKFGAQGRNYGGNGNVLVCGGKGAGKTAIISAVLRELGDVHVAVVQCKSEKKLLQTIQRSLVACAMCAPAALVLDNFDAVAPVQKEHSVEAVSGTTRAILEGALLSSASTLSLHGSGSVVVIATCANRESVNENLRSAFCFTKVIKVEAIDREARLALLKQLFPKEPPQIIEDLGNLMNNYTPFDVKKVSEPIKNSLCEGKGPLYDVARSAIGSFTPLSHTGISFLKNGKASLGSVGGLGEARKVLHDTLVLPMKHPNLFARLPLKTRSGVLLYGAPGCGKTFVVEATVNTENLNCIVVNGPEVFGKYIGQSEEKIRDIFERAQAAAPCVIFFDEFDSVAPQRGVDNSGVTDRVVNQLLCYLDGVESRKDVYVVAASSRPDLIDAALLRPGRLDKAVYCPIPSLADRVEILTVCFKQIEAALTPEEIEEIAGQTTNWTPADLVGLASSANLIVSRRVIERLSVRSGEQDEEDRFSVLNVGKGTTLERIGDSLRPSVRNTSRMKDLDVNRHVTLTDVQQAMATTKPSLTSRQIQEQERLHRLFSRQGKTDVKQAGTKLTSR